MEIKDLNTFDPTVEKLSALVAESAGIVEVNLDDPQQIELVKKARLKLRNARVAIEKTGKAYREDALAYQRAVLEKERSLIAIIEPEETRLKLFEKSAELAKERRIRLAQMPERRKRIEDLGLEVNESLIIEMDSVAFETHINGLVAEKNRKDREAIEAKEREQKEERERLAREKRSHRINQLVALGLTEKRDTLELGAIVVRAADLDLEDQAFSDLVEKIRPQIEQAKKDAAAAAQKEKEEAEERGRQQERERQEKEAREKKEREEREAREKKEKEDREKAELESKKKYQKFLADAGWSKEKAADFKEERADGAVILWKKVGTFKI